MTSLEYQRALRRSALWIARQIDLSYATDRELLQIIEQQPDALWHGSGRAIAARWEAQRRGLVGAAPPPGDDPYRTRPLPLLEPSSPPRSRPPRSRPLRSRPSRSRFRRIDTDALLVSLILHDPVQT